MRNWYNIVNLICFNLSRKYKCELWQVAGILTAFSAQKEWKWNIRQTIQFLQGKEVKGMYSQSQMNAAIRILAGEDPLTVFYKTSFKYRNFYACIVNPGCNESVCVDTHMINWYKAENPYSMLQSVEDKQIFKSKRYYSVIQNRIRKEAKTLGLLPMEYQAIKWTEIRGGAFAN